MRAEVSRAWARRSCGPTCPRSMAPWTTRLGGAGANATSTSHETGADMGRLQRRRFSDPDDVRIIPHGRIDVVELDDRVIGRMTYEPGWRWSVDIKPIAATDLCQFHHVGVTLSGVLRAQMRD